MGIRPCWLFSNESHFKLLPLGLKRKPPPLHDSVWDGAGTVMIRRGKIWEQILSGNSCVKASEDDSRSFQLTMLRAFLLPPACRDVFVLKEIQGYTLSEVAAVLGISRDDVTMQLRRAWREMQTS